MRKILILLLVATITLCAYISQGVAEEQPVFSLDAINQFSNIWSDYYTRYNMNMRGSYILSEDKKSVKRFCIL